MEAFETSRYFFQGKFFPWVIFGEKVKNKTKKKKLLL